LVQDTCIEWYNKNENKAVADQGQRSCKVQATKQVTKGELFQIVKVQNITILDENEAE
jgi:hypothetical protein